MKDQRDEASWERILVAGAIPARFANFKEVKMLEGETILSGAGPSCCGKVLKFEVLHTPAGYYVGTFCPNCGPYSRETGYFATEGAAQGALDEFNSHSETLPGKRE